MVNRSFFVTGRHRILLKGNTSSATLNIENVSGPEKIGLSPFSRGKALKGPPLKNQSSA